MAGIHWLASYPKSGNTWLRAFISNLLADRDAPVDINSLDASPIASDRQWLDRVLGFSTAELAFDEIDCLRPAVYRWSAVHELPGWHKVHDAWSLAPDGAPLFGRDTGARAVYILRNPLDVATSFAHHRGTDVDEAIAEMGNPQAALSSHLHRMPPQVRQKLFTWSQHVCSWVEQSELPRLVLRYEDLLDSPVESFAKAADFLGLPGDATRLARAVANCSFKELSRQETVGNFTERPPAASRFFRRGGRGHWREELTPAQAQRIIDDHHAVMTRFGYLDVQGRPL